MNKYQEELRVKIRELADTIDASIDHGECFYDDRMFKDFIGMIDDLKKDSINYRFGVNIEENGKEAQIKVHNRLLSESGDVDYDVMIVSGAAHEEQVRVYYELNKFVVFKTPDYDDYIAIKSAAKDIMVKKGGIAWNLKR